jgi:hypothetical protein
MFLELIATVFAGIAVAGITLMLNKLTGARLPRWVTPVAAGLAMIGFTVSMEYSWFSRTATNLPEGVVVAQTVEKRSFYQPWTYVAPYVQRFVAVDQASLRSNPDVPGQRMADLYFFGRWAPVQKVPVLVDCAGRRWANLVDGMEFAADGQVVNADWVNAAEDHPVLASVCGVS